MRPSYFIVFLTIYLICVVFSKPLFQKNQYKPSITALKFMKQFGYIEEGSADAEALYTEEGLKDVIKTVQKFGAIPETGVIDNATIKLMQSPRCGVPDIIRKRSKRFVIGSKGWKKRNLTYLVANWSQKLGKDVVRKQIKVALNTWGKYARLNFKEVEDTNADIIIAFGSGYHGDRYPFDGPGNILAHAFFPYEMGSYGGDVHFDNDEDWIATQEKEGIHFYTVALHELGHSLGLGHSPVPNSVMFPYYINYNPENILEYDDVLAMYELYIKRTLEEDEAVSTTTDYYYEETTQSYDSYDEETSNDYPSSSVAPTEELNDTVVYHGDYENVDDHKEHDDKHTIPTTNSPTLPDICQGSYDAVATLREELFIFKDQYVWRLKEKNNIEPGYPVTIGRMFPLPNSVKKIDAAYERPDGMIVLFYGRNFWVYDGLTFIENTPKSISSYGIGKNVKKVDAAQVWAKNGKTYLYSEDYFWRYNETTRTMDPGYPKHIERWRGVPANLDAATTWKDGRTYFFKGKNYWKFNNDWVIVSESSPLPSPQIWLGCPQEYDE